MEFAYNNSCQFTIGMEPFEPLYRRSFRLPTSLLEVGDNKLLGSEMIQDTTSKIELI